MWNVAYKIQYFTITKYTEDVCTPTKKWIKMSPPSGYEECHVMDKVEVIECVGGPCTGCVPDGIIERKMTLDCYGSQTTVTYHIPTTCNCA